MKEATKTAYFRFYEELNDFLPEEKRKVRFAHDFKFKVSVKDVIESIGVPHAEVDMILVNGISTDFNWIVNDGDDISVYPVFESFDISDVQHLRPKPLREPKFILDVHLGSLAKYMRMAGIDASYSSSYNEESIISAALNEHRTILTKNSGLLKQNEVTHDYYVRSSEVEEQLKEVIRRFHLETQVKPFSRCMECNTLLEPIEKNEVEDRLPDKVKLFHDEFSICPNCKRVYWKGSHYERMRKLLMKLEIPLES